MTESALSPGGCGPGIAIGSCSSRLCEPRGITSDLWPWFLSSFQDRVESQLWISLRVAVMMPDDIPRLPGSSSWLWDDYLTTSDERVPVDTQAVTCILISNMLLHPLLLCGRLNACISIMFASQRAYSSNKWHRAKASQPKCNIWWNTPSWL